MPIAISTCGGRKISSVLISSSTSPDTRYIGKGPQSWCCRGKCAGIGEALICGTLLANAVPAFDAVPREPWNLGKAVGIARQLEKLNVYWMGGKALHRGDDEGGKA